MANDIIKMNYPMADAMARTMGQGAKQLEASIGEMNKAVSLLEGGGLRGDAGEAFASAMRGSLLPSMQRLQEKFEEIEKDIRKNIDLKKRADQESKRAIND